LRNLSDVIERNRARARTPEPAEPGEARPEPSGLSKVDIQKIRWRSNHERDPELLSQARMILKKLNGQPFEIMELSQKHEIFFGYVHLAAMESGYRESRCHGTADQRDWIYEQKK